jgi:hypothetical protein
LPNIGLQLYVARAASAITANYLQQVFAQIAGETRTSPPQVVDLVPLLPGDSGTGSSSSPSHGDGWRHHGPCPAAESANLVDRAPRGRGSGDGAVGATTAYITAISLNVLPNKPVLLLAAFLLSVIVGELLVGLAPFLKQHFLPVVMTFILILGVPSAGATMMPDLLPTGRRYLSDVLPLAQGVKIMRSLAYFDGAETLAPTLILLAWAAIAVIVLGFAYSSAKPRVLRGEAAVAGVDSGSSSGVLPQVTMS